MTTASASVGVATATLMAMFGLPPIDLHGPLHYLGVMDPLCDGTRAARYTMLGEWRLAWRYNPLGLVAVVGSAAVVGRAIIGVITGRWLSATRCLDASASAPGGCCGTCPAGSSGGPAAATGTAPDRDRMITNVPVAQLKGAARRAGLLLVAVLLVALAGCTTQTAGDEETRTGSQTGFIGGRSLTQIPVAERRSAPVATGPALSGDGTVSTADYPGKVVVINVWGSWCAPCRKEAPDLAAASQDNADVAQFIGINIRDYDPATARAVVRAFNVPYPSIYDPSGAELVKFADLPPSGIPSTLLIDRKGRIAARVVGTVSKTTLTQMISDIAAEQ